MELKYALTISSIEKTLTCLGLITDLNNQQPASFPWMVFPCKYTDYIGKCVIRWSIRKEEKAASYGSWRQDVLECLVSHCEHASFTNKRGCRKHVSKHHGWYYYFDEPPQVMIEWSKDLKQTPGSNVITKSVTMKLPSTLKNSMFAKRIC